MLPRPAAGALIEPSAPKVGARRHRSRTSTHVRPDAYRPAARRGASELEHSLRGGHRSTDILLPKIGRPPDPGYGRRSAPAALVGLPATRHVLSTDREGRCKGGSWGRWPVSHRTWGYQTEQKLSGCHGILARLHEGSSRGAPHTREQGWSTRGGTPSSTPLSSCTAGDRHDWSTGRRVVTEPSETRARVRNSRSPAPLELHGDSPDEADAPPTHSRSFAPCATSCTGGMRFRVHVKDLPGRPDIVLNRAKVAVFVDGCFWHMCPDHGNPSWNNRGWWRAKLWGNKRRDRSKDERLLKLGWIPHLGSMSRRHTLPTARDPVAAAYRSRRSESGQQLVRVL